VRLAETDHRQTACVPHENGDREAIAEVATDEADGGPACGGTIQTLDAVDHRRIVVERRVAPERADVHPNRHRAPLPGGNRATLFGR